MSKKNSTPVLTPYMSPLAAWAFAIGTSLGWGSLVVTSNTYLVAAGPAGTTLGLVIGALIMLVIARNYAYMIQCYPDAGGPYTYAKSAFGYDHGFLAAWFLGLTYMAMFWANASSLPVFAKYFLGDMFQFGFHYSVFGYEIYLGEIFLSMGAIILIALLCTTRKKITSVIMIGCALFFSFGIVLCFIYAALHHSGSKAFDPAFIPDTNAMAQVIRVACISSWAFIGFENISHAAEEYTFPHKKVFRILTVAVITTTLLYIFVTLLSAFAYPAEYGSWQEYLQDHSNLSGIKSLPAFYVAYHYLGRPGIVVLVLSLLALIITSLIGNTVALSRLFYALARDNVIPKGFTHLNKHHVPARAILLMAAISLIIPFFGRTAIGWIVDVTTIGATIVYCYVSASAYKTARDRQDSIEIRTGLMGIIVMVLFGAFILLPNLFSQSTMSTESYFLFAVWGVLGFIFFRNVLSRNKNNLFGKSIIVWIALLSLVLFTALVWMGESTISTTSQAMQHLQDYYLGTNPSSEQILHSGEIMAKEMNALRMANVRIMLVVVGLFVLALITMMNNYNVMRKRAEETEHQLGLAMSAAKRDPLTGVKSKHAYIETEKILDQQIQEGSYDTFAILVFDVNGLKHINDVYGHKAGDQYICSASSLICDMFEHSPVFRIGGDEFAVILTGKDYNNRVAILAQFNEVVEGNIGTDNVVISAGISDFDKTKDTSLHDVFERADAFMYIRKKELKEMGARTR